MPTWGQEDSHFTAGKDASMPATVLPELEVSTPGGLQHTSNRSAGLEADFESSHGFQPLLFNGTNAIAGADGVGGNRFVRIAN